MRRALDSMAGFEYCGFQQFSNAEEIAECDIFYRPVQFHLHPNVDYRQGETPSVVLAAAELFGVAFNQGTSIVCMLCVMSCV